MMHSSDGIREIREDDDFVTLSQLLEDHTNRFLGIKIVCASHAANELRSNYCSGDPYSKGFIYEESGKIIAFAGVNPLRASKNGMIGDWFTLKNHEHLLDGLINQWRGLI